MSPRTAAVLARMNAISVLYRNGATYDEISDELGINRSTVTTTIRRMRIDGWNLERRMPEYQREHPVQDEIERLARIGMPHAEIAERLSITTGAVSTIVADIKRDDLSIGRRRTQTGHDPRAALNAEIERRAIAGDPYPAIAADLGITHDSVLNRVRRMRAAGRPIPTRKPGGRTA